MQKNLLLWSGLLAAGCLLIAPSFAQPETGRTDAKLETKSEAKSTGAEPAREPVKEVPPAAPRITPELLNDFAGVMCVTAPSRRAEMGFQQPSKVSEVLVRGGAEVTKGQLIVRGDDKEETQLVKLQQLRSESDLPVQKAKAQMDLAKVEYERLVDIRKMDASSTQEVERARLTFDSSRIDYLLAQRQQTEEVLQLARLQARVDRLHIEAPFDGIVDTVSVDVGQSVSESDKIVRVVNIDALWIDVGAPTQEAKTLALQPGDPAWVMLDVAGQPKLRLAKVIEVSPTADLGSRTRRVRVEVLNPKGPERVIAGEAAWVRFTEPSSDVMSRMMESRPAQ
ncbi:MAG: efflux RND transporter periplasmic adaptor subunit [Phycisphaerales bacterium]|jgi:RND family efflux transporter MFP subunit